MPDALARNLDGWFRVELTYTSNAIEGNTLGRRETALVVEKGLTVGGKSLLEHMEAVNHARALDWVKKQAKRRPHSLTEEDILQIQYLIMKGIDDLNAGRYRVTPVRISGSAVALPNPRKVPDLMAGFAKWLKLATGLHPVELAAEAHYRLVTIHPFTDGNGRTARLLMNMILLMSGYPAAIIRKRDRLDYIDSLEKAQLALKTLTLKLSHGQLTGHLISISRQLRMGKVQFRTVALCLKSASWQSGSTREIPPYATGPRKVCLKSPKLPTPGTNSTHRRWLKE